MRPTEDMNASEDIALPVSGSFGISIPVTQRCMKDANSDAIIMSQMSLLIASWIGMMTAMSERPPTASVGLLRRGMRGTTPRGLGVLKGTPARGTHSMRLPEVGVRWKSVE